MKTSSNERQTLLPRKIKTTERDIDRKVAEKLVQVHPHKNWLLEVKVKGGRMRPHQKAAQKQVENGTFLHKFPDAGVRTPADYVHLGDADAIVCVYDPGKRTAVCTVNDVRSFTIRI